MNTTGHAFVEARKRKALKEYKKLLRETREKSSTEPTTSESEQNLHPSQLDAKRRETLVRVLSFSIYTFDGESMHGSMCSTCMTHVQSTLLTLSPKILTVRA